MKSITTEIAEIRDKVDSDLKVINADTSPYVFEMKEEYLKAFESDRCNDEETEVRGNRQEESLI